MMDSYEQLREEHRMNLTMCSNVLNGFRKGISTIRIKRYADWFWNHHLSPHFMLEEKMVFPLLGNKHPLIKMAIADHRRLRRLFENQADAYKTLGRIEEELEAHIRFEEKVLFREIANARSRREPESGLCVQCIHPDVAGNASHPDEWNDEFWK